jgi:hypothetical protein
MASAGSPDRNAEDDRFRKNSILPWDCFLLLVAFVSIVAWANAVYGTLTAPPGRGLMLFSGVLGNGTLISAAFVLRDLTGKGLWTI